MDDNPRLRALRMLQDEDLSVESLLIWFIANGGDSFHWDPIGFEAALLNHQAWDAFDLIILRWAIEDALAVLH